MGSSGLLSIASAVSHSTIDLKFVRVKKADASSGSLLPPAPVVAAMVLFDELPLSRKRTGAAVSSPVLGAAFLHKGQPLFEKLMLRAGFYARGLRMASAGPWATLERCAGLEASGL